MNRLSKISLQIRKSFGHDIDVIKSIQHKERCHQDCLKYAHHQLLQKEFRMFIEQSIQKKVIFFYRLYERLAFEYTHN